MMCERRRDKTAIYVWLLCFFHSLCLNTNRLFNLAEVIARSYARYLDYFHGRTYLFELQHNTSTPCEPFPAQTTTHKNETFAYRPDDSCQITNPCTQIRWIIEQPLVVLWVAENGIVCCCTSVEVPRDARGVVFVPGHKSHRSFPPLLEPRTESALNTHRTCSAIRKTRDCPATRTSTPPPCYRTLLVHVTKVLFIAVRTGRLGNR